MLKFTKYGKGPGGKASFSSSQKQKSESDVAMQAFKVATQPTQVQDDTVANGKGHTASTNKIHSKIQSFPESKTHLLRTKLSKDELMKMENKEGTIIGEQLTDVLRTQGMDSKLGSLKGDINKPEKRRYQKSKSFRSASDLKLPIFNDGYFPKVRPLCKLFLMKRSGSDSGLVSKY